MNSNSEIVQIDNLSAKEAEFIIAVSFSIAELDNLEKFFRALPDQTGMAFVLVAQNDAQDEAHSVGDTHKRFDALAKFPVLGITPAAAPLADKIYLSGDKRIGLRNGRFCELGKHTGSDSPAQGFLASLARDQKDKAAAVVLGTAGIIPAAGLIALHASGGLVLSYDELSEVLPSTVSEILYCAASLDEMPALLVQLLRNPYLLLQKTSGKDAHLTDTAISSILGLLKTVYDTDFQVYKSSIFLRRVERQLRLCQYSSVEDYFTHVSADRSALHKLYLDLQFGNPAFFQNSELLALLQHMVFPQVLQQAEHEHEIRIWVPACATGEETYSLGMLLLDVMDSHNSRKLLKIFATDINEARLKTASDGIYTASQLQNLPENLRLRYFTALEGGRFKVVAALRNRIHFSRHNLLTDVPFNGIDFIFCHSLLSLLNPEARIHALSSIFFALKLNGGLLLGTGETLQDLDRDFEKLEVHWNLYRKIEAVSTRLKLDRERFAKTRSEKNQSSESRMNRIYDILLNRHIPPGVLIDEKRQVLHIFGNVNRFLHPAAGRSSNDLAAMLDGNVKAAVTSLIYNSFNRNASLSVRNLQAQKDNSQYIDINSSFIVDPVTKIKYLLISFSESEYGEGPGVARRALSGPLSAEIQEQVQSLEKELFETRASLQTLMEQMEIANNELQARNAELQDINDVLAASNDELLSTNEELRLLNTEQRTVNEELEQKVRELDQSSTDIQNLIAASDTAIIFTDEQLGLRFYTPAATRLLQIQPECIGRPIQQLMSLIPDDDLHEVISAVQEGKADTGRQITTPQGNVLHRRVSVYNRKHNGTGGVIIVFVDITGLAKAQASLFENEQQIKQITESLQHMIWTTDPSGVNTYANAYLLNYTGVSAADLKAGSNTSLVHGDDRLKLQEQWTQALATGVGFQQACRFRRHDGVYRWFRLDAVPMRRPDGSIYQWLGSCVDIQEGKAADDQVVKVIQGAPLAILLVDTQGIIRQINRQTQLWFGYSEKELIGQEVEMLLDPSTREQHRSYLRKYMEHPQARSMGLNQALNGVRKSGETFGVEIGLNPVELGGQRYVMAFITDITLKIQAEKYLKDVNDSLEHVIEERSQALLESQRRLQLATQTAEIGVFDYDLKTSRVTYDNKMFELFGIPRTQDMAIDVAVWRSCIVEEDLDEQLRLLQASIEQKNVNLRSTYRIHRYDTGELRYIYSNRRSVTDATGKVVRVIGVNRDVTESKKVEMELRELTFSLEEKVRMRSQEVIASEHRLRQMTDTSSVLFWITDAAGKLTWVNKTWEDWTGRSMQAEIDGDWASFIHPEDRKQTISILHSHITLGESFSLEYRLLNAQGNYGWIYHQGSPLYNNDGEVEGCIGTCTDITWQKERAEEQKRIEKKLEATAKLDSLGLMAGGVAHDFNNLLTGILGNIELAQWEVNSEQPMLKTVLSDARMATLRAADLCKQMLAYSGKGQFLTENCDVNEIVRETLRFISNSIKHEVKVLTHLDEGIPSIIADKVQLQQIIMNLTINAGESITEKGVVIIRTGITTMDKENQHALVGSDTGQRDAGIFIEVRDNGIGMTPEELSHAFEPFYTTKFIGRGLGLAAVQGIVKGHGGTLVVETTKGKGTLMRVALPVFQVTKADTHGAASKKDFGWDSKILVVDDEEIVARTLHRYLEHMRVPSDYVLSGKECVSRFMQDPQCYDLVILDLTMAGMDGYETFTQIRKYNQEVKVVLISGFTEKEATRYFGSDDLAGFLPKPISEKALADIIKKLAR
jgi:PAS domain S-box-containing protein